MKKEELKNIVRHVFHFYDVNTENCNWTNMNDACGEILKVLEQEPCENAVSRKDIYFKLTNGAYPNETIEQFIDRLVKELEASPSITLQPKVAQWISKGDEYPAWEYCSKCDVPWTFHFRTPNFCPNCGAKMETGGDCIPSEYDLSEDIELSNPQMYR